MAHPRPARLAEVAKLAGVSPGLVSRIINEDPALRVREETRASVVAAIEMLNYRPNAAARALRNSQTGLLGFALHDVHDPVYVDMVHAAQAAAASHDYAIMLIDTADLAERREMIREIVQSRRIDGMLIQTGFGGNDAELQQLTHSVPTVVFNGDPAPGIRSIRADDRAAAKLATRYLIDAGHTAIAFFGMHGATAARRFDGYQAAIAEAGLTPLGPINVGWNSDTAHDATVQLLRSGTPITAIVAFTVTTALGVSSGIVESGLRIPDDISMISLPDTWLARHLTPPLTVVTMPFDQVGGQAVAMLIDQIQSPSAGEVVVREPLPEIIERGSVHRRADTDLGRRSRGRL